MALDRVFTYSPLAVHNFFMRERNQWSDLQYPWFNYPSPCYTNNSNFGQEYWYSLPEIKTWNDADILILSDLQRISGPGGSLLNLLIYRSEVNHLPDTYWTKMPEAVDSYEMKRAWLLFTESEWEDKNK